MDAFTFLDPEASVHTCSNPECGAEDQTDHVETDEERAWWTLMARTCWYCGLPVWECSIRLGIDPMSRLDP